VLFAVDQQQYLQGYLPIVFLKLFKHNANTVGGGQPVLTGPGFVDKATRHRREAADAGTR
jgi:simple sugar transport system substrate-binding protein